MKILNVVIEKSSDSYGAYIDNVDGIYGAGDTVQECKQSILDGIETVKTYEDHDIPESLKEDYEFTYTFDVESFLQYYKGIFSNAALERLTGVNQKLMQHYSTGLKKPRPAQRKKIQDGLHKLAKELLAIQL